MSSSSATTPMIEALWHCRRQQRAWAALPVRQRLRPVRNLRHLLVSEADRLCAAVAEDMGKTAEETLAGDLLPAADALRFLQRHAALILRPRRVPLRMRPLWLWGQADTVHRRPRGVVGLITTWNYPLLLTAVPLAQALTAGNGVLWKPSELATNSAARLFELLREAGFPPELVQLLPATREAGPELADLDIDHVAFTGSAVTGRRLAAHLGERLVSSTLELSGCDAMLVLADADVSLAARAAWFGAMLNRGQTCLAVRRALVHRSQYAAFTRHLQALAAGAAPVSLAMERQVTQADHLVQDALAGGARLLDGTGPPGTDAPDRCRPTIVLDVRPEMAIWREDSFAPLLAVAPFDTLEEAVRSHNACPFGLGASIFTRHVSHAERLEARLRTGMVTINEVIVPTAHPATPFGGRGSSGWGVTQGIEGLLEMTVPQVVSVSTSGFRPHYDLAGMRQGQEDLVRGLLDWQHGETLGRRWKGLLRLVRAVWNWPGNDRPRKI